MWSLVVALVRRHSLRICTQIYTHEATRSQLVDRAARLFLLVLDAEQFS